MTGKTTALSFLDVYTHIHTQRKQYLQLLVSVLHTEVTGGLSCSNSTNIELYINFYNRAFTTNRIPPLFDKPQAIKAMKLYNMVQCSLCAEKLEKGCCFIISGRAEINSCIFFFSPLCLISSRKPICPAACMDTKH